MSACPTVVMFGFDVMSVWIPGCLSVSLDVCLDGCLDICLDNCLYVYPNVLVSGYLDVPLDVLMS